MLELAYNKGHKIVSLGFYEQGHYNKQSINFVNDDNYLD